MRLGSTIGPPKPKRRVGRGLLLLALVGAAVFLGLTGLRVGSAPSVRVETNRPGFGKNTVIRVHIEGTRLARVQVGLAQGAQRLTLKELRFVATSTWTLAAPETMRPRLEIPLESAHLSSLREGPATLTVTVLRHGTWLKSLPTVTSTKTLPVRLLPPSIQPKPGYVLAAQGGAEVVVYEVGKTAVRHGVRAGRWWFRGYPLPGGTQGTCFAFFSVPYDLGSIEKVRLVAQDAFDNEATAPFIDRFKANPFKKDTIHVSDRVLEQIVPGVMQKTPSLKDRGSLVDNYIAMNRDLRRQNRQRLKALAEKSVPKFLWNKAFVQMKSKVISAFADRRTYYYEGREIDRQDHLGYDLASFRRGPIPASNDGLVVLAEYFGIFGQAVVIDHGYGLMSLYGHLSKIEVRVGDRVTRGHVIGRTGSTGLALGDHLHFTLLLHGLAVDPLEWWDGHWIRDRIAAKLGAALSFVSE